MCDIEVTTSDQSQAKCQLPARTNFYNYTTTHTSQQVDFFTPSYSFYVLK